jgi:hypothetical protein
MNPKFENHKRYKIKVLFVYLFIAGLLLHVVFFILTKKYLISSGIFFIILISIIIYFIIKTLSVITNFRFPMREIQLAILTVAICLILIEISFVLSGKKSTYLEKRYLYYYTSGFDPERPDWFRVWDSDHNLKTGEFCYHRTINSEGLSDKEPIVIKKRNEYRIIALGDSFTEGDGADADSTWLKFLERSLAKYRFKRALTFINAGVCGSDPYFEYVLLKERLLKYKPDLVLLAVNNSDISEILIRGGMERFRPDGTLKYNPAPWWEPIYAMSHISRLLFSALGYNDILLKDDQTELLKSKQKIIDIICTFKKLSEKGNFKLVVIFHPFKSEINLNKLELESVMKSVSANNDVEVLNMLKYYNNEKIDSNNSNDYFWKQDGHHNAKGYAAFASGVEWKLKQIGIIDSLMCK